MTNMGGTEALTKKGLKPHETNLPLLSNLKFEEVP